MIDLVGPAMAGMAVAFSTFGQPARYVRPDDDGECGCDCAGTDLLAFARGLRAVELEASAQQYDRLVVVRADALAMAGLWPPQRFDRIVLPSGSFAVEDWRPAPASGVPVFAKLFAKGAA